MVMKRLVELFPVGLSVMVVVGLLWGTQGSSAVGTWKLDLAESKYGSVSPPKSGTRTVEARPDGVSVSYEFVESDGSVIKYSYDANFDQKDCPITGSGGPNWREDMLGGAETIALRSFGPNVYAAALKKSGNVVMTTRTVISKGGKVTTVITNGADAKGQPTKNVLVWDKQ
jgi:hypothetical protein